MMACSCRGVHKVSSRVDSFVDKQPIVHRATRNYKKLVVKLEGRLEPRGHATETEQSKTLGPFSQNIKVGEN